MSDVALNEAQQEYENTTAEVVSFIAKNKEIFNQHARLNKIRHEAWIKIVSMKLEKQAAQITYEITHQPAQ